MCYANRKNQNKKPINCLEYRNNLHTKKSTRNTHTRKTNKTKTHILYTRNTFRKTEMNS